jgi:hypothetical protein
MFFHYFYFVFPSPFPLFILIPFPHTWKTYKSLPLLSEFSDLIGLEKKVTDIGFEDVDTQKNNRISGDLYIRMCPENPRILIKSQKVITFCASV